MKGKVKYMYPYNAPSYRPTINITASKYGDTLTSIETYSNTYDADPTLTGSEWVGLTDYVDFDLSLLSNNPIKNGLVAEYLFYEGSGTVLHDTSGNGNHGTINGATWTKLSNGKWSLSLDGSDDYVSMPNNLINNMYSNNQNLPNYMTIEVLFKPLNDIWGVIGVTNIAPFDNPTEYIPFIYSDSNHNIIIADWSGHANIYNSDMHSTPTFYHIVEVLTHTPSNTEVLETYINGQFKASLAKNISAWPEVPYNYLGIAYTGGVWNNNGWQKLQGFIALVRIFNYALSSSEVSTLYNMAKQLIS